MKYLFYIFCAFCFIACEDCQDHYFTDSEKSFIPYEIGDSIRVISIKEEVDSCQTIREFEVITKPFTTPPSSNSTGLSPCGGIFEKLWVDIGYNESSDYASYQYFFSITITKEHGDFNMQFHFHGRFSCSENSIKFMNYTINENADVYRFDNRIIDNKSYNNVYLLVTQEFDSFDRKVEEIDSLYYSPNYGLIKLITHTGTYTFENLN